MGDVENKKFETKIIRALSPQDRAFLSEDFPAMLLPAAEAIQEGELVAFPTETVYGLGADAFNESAIAKIYEAKGRPQDNPLIVHLADLEDLSSIAREIPEEAIRLFKRFSPGPLSIILKVRPELPDIATAGLDTVAVRFPGNDIARELIRLSKTPLVAPSANISGRPSPTLAEHVYADLQGKIPFIIDGGPCRIGVESTVLDLSTEQACILRPGGISREALEEALGRKVYASAELIGNHQPKAPGMKYKHYAPRAKVRILPESLEYTNILSSIKRNFPAKIGFYLNNCSADILRKSLKAEKDFMAKPIEILGEEDFEDPSRLSNLKSTREGIYVFAFGEGSIDAAHYLFAAFRWFDEIDVKLIYAQELLKGKEASAYMNRLRKAAADESLPQ